MNTGRWLAGAAGLVVLGALAIVLHGRDGDAAPEPPKPPRLAATDLTSMFSRYGDTSGQWTGGDNTASVPLPDGRVAWLFSDTFLGKVNADHTRPRDSPFINNTIVVQEGAQPVRTLHGGAAGKPTALVAPPAAGEYYWAQDGTVEGDHLQAFYNRYRRTGTGLWDFTLTGSALVTFDLPGLAVKQVTDLPLGDRIAWGSAVLEDGGHTYVYGAERTSDAMRFAHVARVPAGKLGGAWEFWTGSGWSTAVERSARLLSGVGTGYSVQHVGDEYVLVTTEGNLLFNPAIVAYTAKAPTGPWEGPRQLHTPPEATPGTSRVSYDARLHPELARSGKLLVSYNVNSLDADTGYTDARVYRPRFVEVDWPPAEPATRAQAPTGLTAAVNDVRPALRWAAVPGAARYWVYERNVTAGQTHPARRPQPVAATSTDAGLLKDGHTYEFTVTADGPGAESPPSATITATRTRPTVPEGLTAKPLPDGRIALTWANPGANLWYWLYQRDTTSGEQWRRHDFPIDQARGFTTVPLMHGHAYEFRIAAIGPSGESAPSAVARVTARYAPPPAPTGLRARPGDARVELTWAAPSAGLTYRLYHRDLTAGQRAFTRGEFLLNEAAGVVDGLVNGHEYEFRVAAVRHGAEGQPSRTVRATPMPPLPVAPTELKATVTAPGTLTLSWKPLGPGVHYWVHYRDLTAGEKEFTKAVYPTANPPALQPGLVMGHEYEVTVSAANLAGEGPQATPVKVTVTQ
jgi:hypothetical protein